MARDSDRRSEPGADPGLRLRRGRALPVLFTKHQKWYGSAFFVIQKQMLHVHPSLESHPATKDTW